eukprot:scaffold1148_cov108-Isochrysis_galbana.AAC.3
MHTQRLARGHNIRVTCGGPQQDAAGLGQCRRVVATAREQVPQPQLLLLADGERQPTRRVDRQALDRLPVPLHAEQALPIRGAPNADVPVVAAREQVGLAMEAEGVHRPAAALLYQAAVCAPSAQIVHAHRVVRRAGDQDVSRRARHADAAGVGLEGEKRGGSGHLVTIVAEGIHRHREAHELAFV